MISLLQLDANPVLVALGLALLHFLWQGAAVAAVLAFILLMLKRRSAESRYAVLYVALLIMSALPAITFAWLYTHVEAPPPAISSIETNSLPAAVHVPNESVEGQPGQALEYKKSAALVARTNAMRAQEEPWVAFKNSLYRACYASAPWICVLWMAGVLGFAVRLLFAFVTIERMRRSGVPVALEHVRTSVHRYCAALGIDRTVTILQSAAADIPLTFGWLKPVVVLPQRFLSDFGQEQIAAVLAHELAHVRRYDYLANWFQAILETLLFYHPAVWWVSARIRHERELCCDNAVVRLQFDPLEYTRTLLALAMQRMPHPIFVESAGGVLRDRVVHLLNPRTESRKSYAAAGGGIAAVPLLAAIAGLSLYVSLAYAQNEMTLQFPEDRSLGQLLIRDAGGTFTATGEGEGWRTFGEAQGVVVKPDGTELALQVTPSAQTDITPLGALPPDALVKLDLSRCLIKDKDLEHIAGLTGLKALALTDNEEITDEGARFLVGLSDLVFLGLEKTKISDHDAHLLELLPQMQFLDMYQCPIDDESLAAVGAMTELKWLGIEDTKFTPAGLSKLRNLTKLEGMTLEKTAIDDASLQHLVGMTNLTRLILQNTKISDAGMEWVSKMPNLQSLNIIKTLVTDDGLSILQTMERLPEIQCNESNVSEAALARYNMARNADIPATSPDEGANKQHSTNPNAPKVGLILSEFTASGPHMMPEPYGYLRQSNAAAGFLDEANFELFAIVEDGTQNGADLSAILRATRLSSKVIVASDVNAISELDVILCAWLINVNDLLMESLTKAVEGGIGFVNVGPTGVNIPGGQDARLTKLLGIRDMAYNWGQKGECKLITMHPIWDGAKIGDAVLPSMVNGYVSPHGIENGTPLLAPPPDVPEKFYPMYVRTLGKGRIVNCQWLDVPRADSPFGKYGLYIRAINWAAKEDPKTQW